jgi:myo-inositol-1(or 4)-monophosphatase
MASANSNDPGLLARAAQALAALVEAARLGGEIAMRDFASGAKTGANIHYKEGGSPVTSADLAVDRFLRARLGAEFPDAGWLSEETADTTARIARSELVIADPIDGTRAFAAGDPRWAVSIAFAIEGRVVAGVVHAPALGETYAASLGQGATLNGAPIRASGRASLAGARIGGPRLLVAALAGAARVELLEEPKIPSLAYRLARVASGSLDGALASTNSHDWDIAGADILLSEAGAGLCDPEGRPLSYNRPETSHGPLAAAPLPLLPELASALRRALAGKTA